jgi:hypothetical protein
MARTPAALSSWLSAALGARLTATVCGLVFVALGLAARYGLSGFFAKYLGVALWASAVSALVAFARPQLASQQVALLALGISWAVELAQLTPGPAWLSSQHLVLRLIFGTTFSVWDLPAYVLGVLFGVAVLAAVDGTWRAQQASEPPP